MQNSQYTALPLSEEKWKEEEERRGEEEEKGAEGRKEAKKEAHNLFELHFADLLHEGMEQSQFLFF